MTLEEVERRLSQALGGPLLGPDAHLSMAPRPAARWPKGIRPAAVRAAAGLLLLFPERTIAHCVLTLRADSLLHHAGQVSLPGGTVEPDETVELAALREAREEIGLDPAGVAVLGRLTPADVPVSGFTLHPVVATARARPRFEPATGEVARILEVPLPALLDPANVRRTVRVRRGLRLEAPCFDVGGTEVWGVTAMVLAEFLTLLGYSPQPWDDEGRT